MDTNIFVSSFFGGNPRRIIDYWKNGEITLCLSKSILEQYVHVLTRMDIGNEQEIVELLDRFRKGFHSIFTANPPDLNIIESDPDDDKFIECAVSLNAKYIITGDNDLLDLKTYFDIEISSPAKFLNQLSL